MIIFKSIKVLNNNVNFNNNIGFVPTMGALHEGHISLIKASKRKCQKTIVSIFINKPQFNKKKDLMVKEFSDLKNDELKALFAKINPIIQNYMKENSIEILMNSKNIFIGNIKADLTQLLINEINSKVEN